MALAGVPVKEIPADAISSSRAVLCATDAAPGAKRLLFHVQPFAPLLLLRINERLRVRK
jgi:hypothetical protein